MKMLTVLTFIAVFALGSFAAQAHAMLDSSDPPVGSTVRKAPGQIKLQFTQQLERSFSTAEVSGPNGARVDHGVSVSGNTMRVSVGALPPGTYHVKWRALSVDTHKTEGAFNFTVGR